MAKMPVENYPASSYLTTLKDAVVPVGHIVVHNHVRPAIRLRLGAAGFTAWYQRLDDTVVICDCKWGPKFGTHYIAKPAKRDLPARQPGEVATSPKRPPIGCGLVP